MSKPRKPNRNDDPLTTKQLNSVLAWSGDVVAAAHAAGYANPRTNGYRIMKNENVKTQLRLKQETMIKESAKLLAKKITVCRADIINRLWELAQMTPGDTSKSITGQIKAAETLSRIFDVKINRTADLDREIEGKTEKEM